MPRRPPPPRRWELTPEEAARVNELRGRPLRPLEALRLAARAPQTGLEIAQALVGGVRDGIRANAGLVWLLDSERVRQAVPDAARSAVFADEQPFLDALLPLLHEDARVLELGAGDGRISRHVAPRVRELVATDVSPVMLKDAEANLAQFPNVRVERTRGFALPAYGDDSFDVVFAQGVFPSLDPLPVLSLVDESRRVLRAGGALVANFAVIDLPAWRDVVLAELRRSTQRASFSAGFHRPYTIPYVESLYRAAGLEVEPAPEPEDRGQRPGFNYVIVVGRKPG